MSCCHATWILSLSSYNCIAAHYVHPNTDRPLPAKLEHILSLSSLWHCIRFKFTSLGSSLQVMYDLYKLQRLCYVSLSQQFWFRLLSSWLHYLHLWSHMSMVIYISLWTAFRSNTTHSEPKGGGRHSSEMSVSTYYTVL